MSTRVQISATVNRDKLAELMPFLEKNLPNVRGFDGCLRVGVLLNENTGAMVLDEEWLSVEQHRNYLAFIEGNGVLGQLASHFDGPPNIQYFDRVLI
jgi:quinol monooxygenase YgiN